MTHRTLRFLCAVITVGALAACAETPPPATNTTPPLDSKRTTLLTRIADDRSTIADELSDAAGARARAAEATLPLPADSPRLPTLFQLIDPMTAQEKELTAALATLNGLRDRLKAGGPLPADIEATLSAAETRAAAADARDKALRHRLEGILTPGS